ncbi:hypothetical protein ABPG74_021277 [Tetrahymena malaccensis]
MSSMMKSKQKMDYMSESKLFGKLSQVYPEYQTQQLEQYEQITIELIKQDKKFSFQEQANSFYSTQQSTTNFNSQASTLRSSLTSQHSLNDPEVKNFYYTNTYNLVQQLADPKNYVKSQQMLSQWLLLQQEKRPNLQLIGWSQLVGQGSQGKVCLDLMQLQYSDIQINKNVLTEQFIPVALKYIDDSDQFKREVMIVQKLCYEYQPKFIYADFQNQVICMEFCISTLEDFCLIPNNIYLNNDQFMASLLIRLMNRIVGLMKTNLIHGDIKPQNTAFAIRNGKIELILLDFGASSYNTFDYCNYYTKAYCHKSIIEMVYQDKMLDIDTILFNELFCACRTIQYLILEDKKSTIFNQSNYDQFKEKYSKSHPITTSIISLFFGNSDLSFTQQKFENLIQHFNHLFEDKFNELQIDFLLQNQKAFK